MDNRQQRSLMEREHCSVRIGVRESDEWLRLYYSEVNEFTDNSSFMEVRPKPY